MVGEHLQIQLAADLGDAVLVLDEIGGEGGRRDQVVTGGMDDDVRQVGNALLHQHHAVGGGEEALVLRQHEQMQGVHLRCRLLHQIPVTQREGVAVGDDGAHRTGIFGPLQAGDKLLHAALDVLHQQGVGGLCHPVEAQTLEQKAVFGLGVQKQVAQSLTEGLLPQLGDDGGRQALSLIGGVHGDALADVALQRAGGNDVVIVQQVDGEGDGRVIIQRLAGEELGNGLLPPRAQRCADFNIHRVTSVTRFRRTAWRCPV